jgi:hypothetical protein
VVLRSESRGWTSGDPTGRFFCHIGNRTIIYQAMRGSTCACLLSGVNEAYQGTEPYDWFGQNVHESRLRGLD